jgi:transposase-like protein
MEDLRGFERRIVERLRELQPLIEEYEELRRLAQRLDLPVEPVGDNGGADGSRTARARNRGRRSRPSRGPRSVTGGTRAVGEQRRARILELVAENPGVTVASLSDTLGVDRTSVHRVVRKLQQSGDVHKSGRGLLIAGGNAAQS